MTTNMKRKFYVSPTPKPAEMTLEDFKEITDWVEIKFVTEIGEDGVNTNVLSLATMDTEFNDKGKGISDAGDQAVTVRHDEDDAGQKLAETLALTAHKYATKTVYGNPKTTEGTGRVRFNRAIVTGPLWPNGSPEDFMIKTFTFGNSQRPFEVPAT